MSASLLLFALAHSAAGQTAAQAPVKGRVGWIRQKGYSEVTPDGRRTGYMFELLDKMTENGSLQFSYVEASSWKELEDMVARGKVDIFFMDNGISTMKGVTLLPGSIGASFLQLCARPDDERFSANVFAALDGKRLAMQDSPSNRDNLALYEQGNGFSTETYYYDTAEEAKVALLLGSVDLAVLSNNSDTDGLVILSKFGLSERRIAVADSRLDLQMAFGFEIRQLIMNDPLYLHSLTLQYGGASKSGRMALSQKEQDFIRKAPVLDVYLRADLPMYSIQDKESFTGYLPALLEKISADTGLQFNLRGYTDTSLMGIDFKDAGNPYSLCVMPKDYSFFRNRNLKATAPATNFTLLLLTRKGYNKDLKTVAYTKDSNLQDLMAEYGLTGVEFKDETASLNALVKGKVDSALVENYVVQLMMNRRKYRNTLTVRFDPVITSDLVFAAQGTADESLMTIMNKAMQNLSKEDLWSYVRASSPVDFWQISLVDLLLDNWFILMLAVLLVLAAVVIILIQHRFTVQLEISNRNKDVFLADMSHDFRTPLTAISGFAYLGKTESDPRYYPDIITSAAYMQELVNDILNIRQYSEGKALELQPQAVIADTLYDSILSVMHGRAAGKNIQIDFDSNISYPYLSLDPMRVRQVFVNIIGNAIKYSPAGSTVEVRVEDYVKNRNVRVKATIRDHGEGMSRDFIRERIFRPFEREKNAFSAKEGGSGLGLAITKIIMDRMGGSIAVESELGKGSTFTLDFPVQTITKEEYEKEHKEDVPSRSRGLDFSGLNVLLCEDNEINTFIVTNLLKKKGCTVDSAENGEIGLNKFKKSPSGYYSLILMDIRMPVMDGMETTRAIRALPREDARTIPIVALSANAFEEDKMESAKAGMNAHLAKPIDVEALFRTMEQLLAP